MVFLLGEGMGRPISFAVLSQRLEAIVASWMACLIVSPSDMQWGSNGKLVM